MLTWSRAAFGRLLLLAGIGLASLTAPPPVLGQSWTDVVPPDARFKLEMPAPVERATSNDREPGLAGVRIVYQAALGKHNFDFDHVEYSAEHLDRQDRKAMVLELGRGVVEKQFPKPRYKYARDEAVVLQGWDGYALDIEDDKGDGVMMRTYLVQNRLYRLLVTYDAQPASKAAAARFVDSFRVADTR